MIIPPSVENAPILNEKIMTTVTEDKSRTYKSTQKVETSYNVPGSDNDVLSTTKVIDVTN